MGKKFSPYDCVGCGYCCRKTPCAFAVWRYGNELNDDYGKGKVCPELRWSGKRYWCRLIKKDKKVAKTLGAGLGCSSSLNSDRRKIPSPKSLGIEVKRCITKTR